MQKNSVPLVLPIHLPLSAEQAYCKKARACENTSTLSVLLQSAFHCKKCVCVFYYKMRLIVKEPFLKKICYSEKCQQQYFIIFVRNRLLISKRCEEKYNIEELYLNLETLARFHYQESCIGSFVQILIQSYDSNEFKGKDVNFCYNVRLRRCQNKIILERKKRDSEEYSNIFTLTRHEDLKHLLNELQDRFL